MITRFSLDLILPDGSLPDGFGTLLLHELIRARYPGGVALATVACDRETATEAVRGVAFDYLIEPYAPAPEALPAAPPDAKPRRACRVDEIFNAYARGVTEEVLPTGTHYPTLNRGRPLFCSAARTWLKASPDSCASADRPSPSGLFFGPEMSESANCAWPDGPLPAFLSDKNPGLAALNGSDLTIIPWLVQRWTRLFARGYTGLRKQGARRGNVGKRYGPFISRPVD